MPTSHAPARAPRGSWMKCPVVAEDHRRVVRAVVEVGHAIPLFTTRDVEKHIEEPKFGGLRKGELSRHLEALNGEVILQVEAEELRSPVGSSYRVWALRERQHEIPRHVHGFGPVTDPERVFLAAHVAAKALGRESVPTREVTEVLKCIPGLCLDFEQNTGTLLNGLAARAEPAVEKVRLNGERWLRWRLLKPANHPRLPQWVEIYERQIRETGTPSAVGHATYSEVGREIVLIAVETSLHSAYPYGRPVRFREIEEKAEKTSRGLELLRSLRRTGIDLHTVLSDATKSRISGEKRVSPRVVRLHGPISGGTYYDIPDAAEFRARMELPKFWDLREAAEKSELERIVQDAQDAQDLQRTYHPDRGGLSAIIATRLFLAAMELDHLEHALAVYSSETATLSAKLQGKITEYRERVRREAQRLPELPLLEEEARTALEAIGLGLAEVAAADHPPVFPSTWAGWFTELEIGSNTPAQHLANAVSLRRFRNPAFVSPDGKFETERCTTFVDRVEALPLAATHTMAALQQEFHAASRLLGRNLRHPGVVVPLLEHPHPHVRRDAFLALVLLDDPVAHDWIALRLGNPQAPPEEVVWALHAAAALGVYDPAKLPAWLRNPSDPAVTQAVQSVQRAHAHGALSR